MTKFMRKAEREGGVRRVFGEDMGDASFVSNDFDAGSEVCDRDRSCRLWQRGAKPDKTEKGADRRKDEEGGGADVRFAKHGSRDYAGRASPKSNSIAIASCLQCSGS